jgi:hypothetical protein
MKKYLQYSYAPLALLSLSLYLLNLLYLKGAYHNNVFVTSYFNDILLTPILLPIIIIIEILFKQRYWEVKPTMSEILFWVVVFSVFFEIIIPKFNPRSTGDYMDTLCYLAGGLLFWLMNGNQKIWTPFWRPILQKEVLYGTGKMH